MVDTKHGYHLLFVKHTWFEAERVENMATVEMLVVPREICQFMHYKLQIKLGYMASTQAEATHSSVLNTIIST